MYFRSFTHNIVWIIGASSGIGKALAQEISTQGAVLALSARREEALQTLVTSIPGKAKVFALDVCDIQQVRDTAHTIYAAFGRIDRVIVFAAAYTPMTLNTLDIASTRNMIHTNILGSFHIIDAVLPFITKQKQAQIAICASVAGYVGLPGAQPYSATKAAIINVTESLRAELPSTIDVKLINPGFVRTDLTNKNTFAMPMIISTQQAAKHIAHGLCRHGFEVHFPKRFTWWLKILRMLPYRCTLAITKRLSR